MLTDATRRAIRVAQVLVVAAAGGIPTLAAAFDVPAGRVAQIVAVFSFLGVLLVAARNHLEDNTSFPAVLKAPPSSGENPVPDPEEGLTLIEVCLVVVVVILVLWAIGDVPR